MTKIKRLAPRACPDCGLTESLYLNQDRALTCRMCGYQAADDVPRDEQSVPDQQVDPRSQWKVTYGTPNTDDVERWAGVKYTSGLDYTRRGNYEEALRAFEQAVDMQRDFIDAHLWIARLSLDPKEKHYHYSEVIAHMPMNLEAKRELMVIKGDMTREEADRTSDMASERDIRDAEYAVGVKMIEIVCSSCGGTLEAKNNVAHVTCQYCGHDEPVKQQGTHGAGQLLTAAMLKDRGQGTQWRVGEFLLHCDNCGAERILTSKKLTTQCPFCGSNHVIKADALRSFRQPDGILPFRVKAAKARQSVEEALSAFTERIKGFFVNNTVETIRLVPVYLPFWVFDVTAQVTVTRRDKRSASSYTELATRTSREEFVDGLMNVPYSGVTSPPHRLTDRLQDYDLSSLRPYDARLLAGFTAEMYSIDYQQASIDVRNEIGERFRFRHGHNPYGDIQTQVSYLIQQMSFRLLMYPVWVVNITEADGDLRIGLVHGQTGQALLGRANRPPA